MDAEKIRQNKKKTKTYNLCDVSISTVRYRTYTRTVCTIETRHNSSCVHFLRHNDTLRHKNVMSIFQSFISTKGASTLVWYCNGVVVCDLIYREGMVTLYTNHSTKQQLLQNDGILIEFHLLSLQLYAFMMCCLPVITTYMFSVDYFLFLKIILLSLCTIYCIL